MPVRPGGLARPQDLVWLRRVEHVQLPRRHEPLEPHGYAVRSIDAIGCSDQTRYANASGNLNQ